MSRIPDGTWDRYKSLMREAHDDFNQDILVWVRYTPRVTQFKEQEEPSGDTLELRALMGYNFFRTWPLTKQSTGGELDNQNMIAMLNRDYLEEENLVTADGYLRFNPDKDYFVHRGIKYKAEGDTFVSQAKNTPLHIILILHREETGTGQDRYNYTDAQILNVIEEAIPDTIYFINNDLPQV